MVDRPCHHQSQPSHPRTRVYGCPCKIRGASLSLVHMMPDFLHFACCFTITRFTRFTVAVVIYVSVLSGALARLIRSFRKIKMEGKTKLICLRYSIASSSSASASGPGSSATATPSAYKHCSFSIASEFTTPGPPFYSFPVATSFAPRSSPAASLAIPSASGSKRPHPSRILHP